MVRNCADLGILLQKLMKRLLANQNLLKLLYYTDKNPLEQPDLTEIQIKSEIFDKLVRITPRISPEDTRNANSVIALRISQGIETDNGEFRNIGFSVDSVVPLTQWIMKSDNLRPFLIMGEVENSLKGKNINGLGKISGGDFNLSFLTEEVSGYQQDFRITTYD